jgi:hypothetical protein
MVSVTFSCSANLTCMRRFSISGICRRVAVVVVAGFLITLMSSHSSADSATAKPVLVELFTSEGCSSCPPADALLRTLDSTQLVTGIQLIGLEEHVDYWDDLGWKDAYSAHAFTVRQQIYADRLHRDGPYTPQMVVDGSLEFVGSNRESANQAFEKARSFPKVMVRISSLKAENGNLHARIETDALPLQGEVFVAIALEHAQSQVLHGENGGHRLEHVAVLRNLISVGIVAKGEPFSKDVNVALSVPGQPYRVIAFVQEPKQGKILGAAVEPVQK